jgi:trigger factor
MMKVNVEDISGVKKKVFIEIPEERVTREINSIFGDLKNKAKIKGFRPGKVPREILERYFKDYVKGEALQKLIQDTMPKAFEDSHLHPVSTPVIDPQELEIGKPFQYSAIVETKPDFKLEGYFGLKIEGKKEEVKEEEVEERLKGLQNLYASLKTIPEPRPIQNGDFVILDYEATLDGRPLEEGKAVDFTVEVGSGRFIPAFEEKLAGSKPEEEKEIEIAFPEDYGYKKWAGKTVSFHVKIKEIKEKILPSLDDEFAKDLGSYSSLEELKAQLRQDLEKEKKSNLERQLKDQLVDQLIQAHPFELPESLVEEQAKSLVSDTKTRLASQGVAFESLGVTEEKLKEDYRETSRKQVRTFLILEKVSEQEGIAVSDEEVEERLKEISTRTRQKLDAVKRYYDKNGLIPEVKAGIVNNKTLDLLLEKAEITYS